MTRGAVPGHAAYTASRPWTPLVLTLGLHLLLVLAWLTSTRGGRVPDPPQRASTFVLVQPPARPEPAPDLPPPSALPHSRGPATIHLPRPVVAGPTAPAPPQAPASEPQADPAPSAAEALPGDLLKSSRAMAGRIDRELRNGASPISAEPERKWERFAQAFAEARTSRSYSMTLESYTDADGTVVYRKTIGGRTSCYRSGSVGGAVTGFGNADGRGAGYTPCPTGVSWTRH